MSASLCEKLTTNEGPITPPADQFLHEQTAEVGGELDLKTVAYQSPPPNPISAEVKHVLVGLSFRNLRTRPAARRFPSPEPSKPARTALPLVYSSSRFCLSLNVSMAAKKPSYR